MQINNQSLADFDVALCPTEGYLAGTDEAGRGALAGPVVAAAVILDPSLDYPGVNDSKKLKAALRQSAYEMITQKAISWAWAAIEAPDVDRLNPLVASMEAMSQAVATLEPNPNLVLVDGNAKPPLSVPFKTVVKGDSHSLAIAAASIIAKVTRDRLMVEYHQQYPQYGFARHVGYGTKIHLEALRQHGPCPIHRLTFRGVCPEPIAAKSLFDALDIPKVS